MFLLSKVPNRSQNDRQFTPYPLPVLMEEVAPVCVCVSLYALYRLVRWAYRPKIRHIHTQGVPPTPATNSWEMRTCILIWKSEYSNARKSTGEVMHISYWVTPSLQNMHDIPIALLCIRFDKGFNNLIERTSRFRHFYLARGAQIRTSSFGYWKLLQPFNDLRSKVHQNIAIQRP